MGSGGKGARLGLATPVVLAILGLVSVGCGTDAALAGSGGCDRVVREHAATIEPRSSGMTCAQIIRMTFGLPAEPGGFLLEDMNRKHVFWHCRLYGRVESGSPILRCTLGRRAFEIDAT
ncbi:MAG TPA: hypothetical protein VGH14_14910 [Solirubrobacterales bacterium]|jgi:hypothetical protein